MSDSTLARELARLPLWGQPGIDCGIRANFRCEYCDRDRLRSLDDYKAWAQDHLVPRKAGGRDDLSNMVVACHPCNSAYKKDWDPRTVAGADASREELIEAARTMIAERRDVEQAVLEEAQRLVAEHRARR